MKSFRDRHQRTFGAVHFSVGRGVPSAQAVLSTAMNSSRGSGPPSSTRAQLDRVRAMLGQETVGIARIAKDTRLTRQTVYRIKDAASAKVALVAWERR